MIHEYALEPEFVASCDHMLLYRILVDNFGLGKSRVVSNYPDWRDKILAEYNKIPNKRLGPTRMKNLLKALKPTVRRSNWDSAKNWRQNIGNLQLDENFIISKDSLDLQPNGFSAETDALQLQKSFDLFFSKLKKGKDEEDGEFAKIVKKSGKSIANIIEPMISISNDIQIVDPYFYPDKKHIAVIKEILEKINYNFGVPEIRLHTLNRVLGCQKKKFEENFHKNFEKDCDIIPSQVANYPCLSIYLWEEKNQSKRFHNRYIFTENGGVEFSSSLDESSHDKIDVFIMSKKMYIERKSEYKIEGSNSFKMIKKINLI